MLANLNVFSNQIFKQKTVKLVINSWTFTLLGQAGDIRISYLPSFLFFFALAAPERGVSLRCLVIDLLFPREWGHLHHSLRCDCVTAPSLWTYSNAVGCELFCLTNFYVFFFVNMLACKILCRASSLIIFFSFFDLDTAKGSLPLRL